MKENIKPIRSEDKKPRGKWKDSYMLFLVLPIILLVLIPLGGAFYLCGRFSPNTIYIFYFVLPAYCIFSIICLITCMVRLFRDWRSHTRNRKVLLATEIAIPLVLVASYVASAIDPKISWPSVEFFMRGFGDSITVSADFDAVRLWLQTLDNEELSEYGRTLSYDKWPESLRILKPSKVFLLADEGGDPKVRLKWGGGVFSWGIVVGMQGMEFPQSDLRLHGELRLPLVPGAYVWFIIQ